MDCRLSIGGEAVSSVKDDLNQHHPLNRRLPYRCNKCESRLQWRCFPMLSLMPHYQDCVVSTSPHDNRHDSIQVCGTAHCLRNATPYEYTHIHTER